MEPLAWFAFSGGRGIAANSLPPNAWIAFFGGREVGGGAVHPNAWFAFLAKPPAKERVPLEIAVGRYFQADPRIAALTSGRVFNDRDPQDVGDETPTLLYVVISRVPVEDLGGETGMVTARVQFDLLGKNRIEAEALQFALRCAIQKTPPLMGGLRVAAAWIDDAQDAADANPSGSDDNRADLHIDVFYSFYEQLD